MALFRIYNGPSPTTAAQVPVTTGTAIKTLLQIKPSATLGGMELRAWGISFDGSAAATPIKCELIETDAAALVTAHVAAGIVKMDAKAIACGDPTTNLIVVGTTATGYTATGEGTTTVTRVFDAQLVAPTNQYSYQWPLGEGPAMTVSLFTRVRVTAGAAVNAYCWIDVQV